MSKVNRPRLILKTRKGAEAGIDIDTTISKEIAYKLVDWLSKQLKESKL